MRQHLILLSSKKLTKKNSGVISSIRQRAVDLTAVEGGAYNSEFTSKAATPTLINTEIDKWNHVHICVSLTMISIIVAAYSIYGNKFTSDVTPIFVPDITFAFFVVMLIVINFRRSQIRLVNSIVSPES